MARPLRIEFAGALYHVTARGNAQQDVYCDDIDRTYFLELLHRACDRHQWLCHAYCLMSNHYHLLIETQVPSLSKGMKYINGSYTQRFNWRHQRVGHIFQGRFKSILVEKNSHLLEVARYITLNPVRAHMVRSAKDWPWSSYRGTAGFSEPHPALTTDWILGGFGVQRKKAQMAYRRFVKEGKEQPSPWESLTNQIYLGSDAFIEAVQRKIAPDQSLTDVPRPQKLSPPKPLSYYRAQFKNRNQAMAAAYRSGHYTLAVIGVYFGVSYATVSRAVTEVDSCKCQM